MPPSSPSARVMIIAAGAAVIVALLVGVTLAPQHQRIGQQTAGDPALADRVRQAVDNTGGYRSLAVAEVTADSIVWAGLGNAGTGRDGPAPSLESRYELGSITKTFTAALFADAIDRGEVTADDQLGEHLTELTGTPAGGVTLGSLAQHRSGLPGLGATAMATGLSSKLLNENPYESSSTAQLITDAKTAPVDPDQPPTYSNLAISLLGTALVRTSGATDYPALVSERITDPLGMPHTGFVGSTDAVPDEAVPGFLVNGTPAPRWPGEGYLPAGSSTFTSTGDQARWAQALLAGDAPGAAALEPTAEFSGAKIGWAWLTTSVTDADGVEHSIVWHNGMTGGFSSMLVLDQEAGRAVVVLGNTTTAVDPIALALLYGTEVPSQPPAVVAPTWFVYGLAALLSLIALFRSWRAKAVLPMIGALLAAAFGLTLLWHSGPWASVGGWAYGLALAPALAAVAIGALRARTLPIRPPRRAWATWLGIAVAALLIIGTIQLW